MTAAKKPFPQDQIANTQLEFRTPIALEFIAHYLDRIDDHLERLAALAQGSGEAVGRLSADFRGAAVALGHIAQDVGKIAQKR